MTGDPHQDDELQMYQDEIRARYGVRPVVYIPLTMLLMLGLGFAFYWALGGNIYGAVAGVVIAPMVMGAAVLFNWFNEWVGGD